MKMGGIQPTDDSDIETLELMFQVVQLAADRALRDGWQKAFENRNTTPVNFNSLGGEFARDDIHPALAAYTLMMLDMGQRQLIAAHIKAGKRVMPDQILADPKKPTN